MTSDLAVSTKLKENYDAYYDGESEWRALGAIDKAANIVDLCSSIPHGRILDIGSGEGAILKRLSDVRFGEILYSLEISQSAVTTIGQRAIPGLKECRLFDGYHIPYCDRQFDLAILSHVLEHVEHPRKLLQEASRVADCVFIEVPLEDTVRMKPDYVFDSVGHINFYSSKTIRRLIQTCGLEILCQMTTHPSRPMYEYLSGRKGILKHAIKEVLLRTSEHVACRLFTYHSSIVCTELRGEGTLCFGSSSGPV
jgi:ubiquinone/menaquinone biosynthesis C-methylase UbiE